LEVRLPLKRRILVTCAKARWEWREEQIMSQQWLSVIGIVLDMADFMILLIEWWLAFFNEERQLGFQRRLERERNQRAVAQANAPEELRKHLETTGKLMDDAALRRVWEAHGGTLVRRKVAFLTATFLIIAGAGLQLAGNWPACCPAIGILPQG
jgi:hypothetical protein